MASQYVGATSVIDFEAAQSICRINPECSDSTIACIVMFIEMRDGQEYDGVGDLFNRFYQAQQVVNGKTRGTGLGLDICKRIVEAHGGKIWAESLEGKGSKSSFSIPVINH